MQVTLFLVVLLLSAFPAAIRGLRYNYGDGSYYVGSVDDDERMECMFREIMPRLALMERLRFAQFEIFSATTLINQ